MADEIIQNGALNTAEASPVSDTSGTDAAALFASSLSVTAKQDEQPGTTALNTGATAEQAPNETAPEAQPTAQSAVQQATPAAVPEMVPYERVQQLTEQNRQYQEQIALRDEAAEHGMTVADYQRAGRDAQMQGFPDTRSYLAYAVEWDRQEQLNAAVQMSDDLDPQYKAQFDAMIKQGQENARTLAVIQTQSARREQQDRTAALSYAQQELGITQLPERLQMIFSKSTPETVRALVDDLKPIIMQQRQEELARERAAWSALNQSRQNIQAPMSANAGGSPAAQAAYDPANPPPARLLFKV